MAESVERVIDDIAAKLPEDRTVDPATAPMPVEDGIFRFDGWTLEPLRFGNDN